MERKSISIEVKSLINLLTRAMEIMAKDDGIEITMVQGWVINLLHENQDADIFQKDIEEAFTIRKPTATKLLNLMEKSGLVTREPVEHDARLKKLRLTEKAEGIYGKIEVGKKILEEKMTKEISDGEMEVFFGAVDKIKANLNKYCMGGAGR